jgi:preprotein translocase subunit SecB
LEKRLSQATVDFAAIGRVSRFSELKDIRLIDVWAKSDPSAVGPLKSEVTHNSSVLKRDSESLQVVSSYRFVGRTAETQAIEINITYLVVYALKAPAPLADEDVTLFAAANGTLHSWPFVREFLHGLTSRMGFPPFKLGVMHFVPMKPAKDTQEGKAKTKQPAADEKKPSEKTG